MRHRGWFDVERRLGHVEDALGGSVNCVCGLPTEMALKHGASAIVGSWPGHEQEVTCPDCGHERYVLRWSFDPR